MNVIPFDVQKSALPRPPGPSCTYRSADVPKPCCHPLITQSGHVLTGYRMSDHFWHRGLWFAIKYINKTNFWEERPAEGFGTQTETALSSFEGGVTQNLAWRSENGEVLSERRIITTGYLDQPYLDWKCELTALLDLELDRTPFTTWGGYSGLTFRGSREMHQADLLTAGAEQGSEAVIGLAAEWCSLQARMDGGEEEWASVTMLSHPSNPRSPSPWYGKAKDDYIFMNAALLFHEPMTLREGETLALSYRVLWSDGKRDISRIREQYQRFSSL